MKEKKSLKIKFFLPMADIALIILFTVMIQENKNNYNYSFYYTNEDIKSSKQTTVKFIFEIINKTKLNLYTSPKYINLIKSKQITSTKKILNRFSDILFDIDTENVDIIICSSHNEPFWISGHIFNQLKEKLNCEDYEGNSNINLIFSLFPPSQIEKKKKNNEFITLVIDIGKEFFSFKY